MKKIWNESVFALTYEDARLTPQDVVDAVERTTATVVVWAAAWWDKTTATVRVELSAEYKLEGDSESTRFPHIEPRTVLATVYGPREVVTRFVLAAIETYRAQVVATQPLYSTEGLSDKDVRTRTYLRRLSEESPT
ncbi:MAG: hypothetical protein WCG26_14965 [Chloroflexales bacterium]